jgi:hypothetical protein
MSALLRVTWQSLDKTNNKNAPTTLEHFIFEYFTGFQENVIIIIIIIIIICELNEEANGQLQNDISTTKFRVNTQIYRKKE